MLSHILRLGEEFSVTDKNCKEWGSRQGQSQDDNEILLRLFPSMHHLESFNRHFWEEKSGAF